jgi:hypothetical protein
MSINGQVTPYNGNDVQTEGPGRYARVTIGGRECWARAWHPEDAATVFTLGLSPRVSVLGWHRGQSVEWSGLDAATRDALLTTCDAGVSWSASWSPPNSTKGTAATLGAARKAAREAYGPLAVGAVVRLYVDDVLVYEEVQKDRGKWHDRELGAW